jgi:antitoxin (DNA-binding transcriptional repressor) of toxin-antitoxin stability system
MSRQVTASIAKATLIALLDDVASGEEVEIRKRGRVVARMVPAGSARALRGCAATIAASNAADEELFCTYEDRGARL